MKIDLHMHSYHSDGKFNCSQLLEKVKEVGIGLFSLTDHDTISGLEEMKAAVRGSGIAYIPGVEIATRYDNAEYHLTIYGYDPNNQAFLKLLEDIKKVRTDYDIAIVKYLEPAVSLEKFMAFEDDPYRGGWPSLNFLLSEGIIEDIYGYFEIADRCPAQMIFPEVKRIVETAHQAGAGVFLAHPSSNGKGGLPKEKLDYFRDHGVDGLECYSPYCKSQEEIQYYLDYCETNNMKISGGSDYHGGFVGRNIGQPHVTQDDISYDYLKQFIWQEGDD